MKNKRKLIKRKIILNKFLNINFFLYNNYKNIFLNKFIYFYLYINKLNKIQNNINLIKNINLNTLTNLNKKKINLYKEILTFNFELKRNLFLFIKLIYILLILTFIKNN
jgi:hypothetical protein